MVCLAVLSDVSFFWYASLSSIWLNKPLNIPRLFHIGHLELFWRLVKYSITETDILWYDLHGYMCCYLSDLCTSSPLLTWRSLTSIMNYTLCMSHDLATANHHDHAWTENWAHNICKLSMPMSIVRLLCNPRKHRQTGHLYRIYVTCKNYPPHHALLNVDFMTILRRTDCFILIWTCSPVLPDHRNYHFQNCPSFKT